MRAITLMRWRLKLWLRGGLEDTHEVQHQQNHNDGDNRSCTDIHENSSLKPF